MNIPGFGLDGKVAIITGSGSGIGRTLAIGLAQAGADIVVTELPEKQEAAEETARAVREIRRKALVTDLDVTLVHSIEKMVEKAYDAFGHLDILINNAGIIIRKNALQVTEEEWDKVLNINLKGVFFTSQAVARIMMRHRGGKIINLASINGVIGSAGRSSYTASKAGVVNLTRTLAAEWAEHGINVNAIGPTYLATPLTEEIFNNDDFRESYFRRQPIKRVGQPEDLVGAAVFLASPASDLVTGHTLMVDGGWTAV
jgi:2-deoxy-D-gluconate 3-dehydrogenase